MTTLRQAVQQALEALEIGYDSAQAEAAQYHAAMVGYRPERHAEMDADVQKIAKAITAVKAVLAQQDQGPVAWRSQNATPPGGFVIFQQYPQALADLGGEIEPLYTRPPRREWRSLSEEEIDRWTPEIHPVIRAIDQALKEKNT
jgi:hypothetical protein